MGTPKGGQKLITLRIGPQQNSVVARTTAAITNVHQALTGPRRPLHWAAGGWPDPLRRTSRYAHPWATMNGYSFFLLLEEGEDGGGGSGSRPDGMGRPSFRHSRERPRNSSDQPSGCPASAARTAAASTTLRTFPPARSQWAARRLMSRGLRAWPRPRCASHRRRRSSGPGAGNSITTSMRRENAGSKRERLLLARITIPS